MTTETKKKPDDTINDEDRPRILHIYQSKPDPVPGDKAMCGHVKKTPGGWGRFLVRHNIPWEWCVVCKAMNGDRPIKM